MTALWVVLGPTASGKSKLALELAERSGGELLCFDSTTVYRELDIGTAKPSPEEQQRAPHHLLDLVDPGHEFSLAQFLQHAEATLADVRSRGRQPILVGGTYLYLRAFLEGFQVPEVPPDSEFRNWADQQILPALVHELGERDPAALEFLDLQNPRRVVRALEVCRAGLLFSDGYKKRPRSEPVRKIGLECAPEWLRQRIDSRSAAMLAQGLQEEVLRLCQKGLKQWLLCLRPIGYPEVIHGLEHSSDTSTLVQSVAESTWRLVKKQRTWGRSESAVRWFGAADADLTDRVWDELSR